MALQWLTTCCSAQAFFQLEHKYKGMEAPKEFKPLIGTWQKLGGYLFSSKKKAEPREYEILDWRYGSGQVIDMKTMKPIHPTVELLVKAKGMNASRWTRGFPCRSVKLSDEN